MVSASAGALRTAEAHWEYSTEACRGHGGGEGEKAMLLILLAIFVIVCIAYPEIARVAVACIWELVVCSAFAAMVVGIVVATWWGVLWLQGV